jgi:UDP-hydrolysing UDP-N-acetyl-D-glucosamine 2-epimerase
MGAPTVKLLIITGSRSDWSGLGMVGKAALAKGHDVHVLVFQPLAYGRRQAMLDDGFGADLTTLVDRTLDGPVEFTVSVLRRTAERLLVGRPDMALLAGDRYETVAAALACSIARVPIAHIAGGDETLGSQDDRYRDAITALACVHFTSTDWARERVVQRAHNGDHILWAGSPAIDRIKEASGRLLTYKSTFEAVGLNPGRRNILVSVHPNSLSDMPAFEAVETVNAVDSLPGVHFVCLQANADAGGAAVNEILRWRCESSRRGAFCSNLSSQQYFSLMQHCDVMVGNSSAAYYEAPNFGLPCVDVGDRQKGRTRPGNVKGCAASNAAIVAAIHGALARGRWLGTYNPYGDGKSAPRIVEVLEEETARRSSAR